MFGDLGANQAQGIPFNFAQREQDFADILTGKGTGCKNDFTLLKIEGFLTAFKFDVQQPRLAEHVEEGEQVRDRPCFQNTGKEDRVFSFRASQENMLCRP